MKGIINHMNLNTILTKITSLGGSYAVFWQIQGQSPVFFANAERFPSASVIKVPLLLAWLLLEREGQVDPNELCHLDAEPQVQGAGFAWQMLTRQLPYGDVLRLMIALSDNLCTNLILQRVGMQRANETFQRLGLTGVRLQRKMMDLEARQRGLDNWITPQDCMRLYPLLDQLPPHQRGFADSLLASCQDDSLLMRDIPRDTLTFHHKTGSLSGILHDWGYTNGRQVFLLTHGFADETAAAQVFGELGRAVLLEA